MYSFVSKYYFIISYRLSISNYNKSNCCSNIKRIDLFRLVGGANLVPYCQEYQYHRDNNNYSAPRLASMHINKTVNSMDPHMWKWSRRIK